MYVLSESIAFSLDVLHDLLEIQEISIDSFKIDDHLVLVVQPKGEIYLDVVLEDSLVDFVAVGVDD
jgi:hypothetical protein